jgi:hypothetical protein
VSITIQRIFGFFRAVAEALKLRTGAGEGAAWSGVSVAQF